MKIMEAATKAGINTLDTARAYGTAEEVVGRNAAPHWRVITKLSPWVTGANVGPAESAERVERSLDESCDALDRDVLDGVLLHRADQRLVGAGAAWSELRRQRDRGRVRAIGVSVVKVDEADAAIEDPEVQLIQVPASLLDQRLLRSGFFDAAAERQVDVFVRSIFLQGVAHLPASGLPSHLSAVRAVLTALDRLAADAGVQRPALFLAWARLRLPSVYLVVGCDTASQLQEDLDAWEHAPTIASVVALAEDAVPMLSDEVLDPWRWPGAL